MNSATSTHDPRTQTTVIAAGHNEKCQLYSCQLAREIVSNSDIGTYFFTEILNLQTQIRNKKYVQLYIIFDCNA